MNIPSYHILHLLVLPVEDTLMRHRLRTAEMNRLSIRLHTTQGPHLSDPRSIQGVEGHQYPPKQPWLGYLLMDTVQLASSYTQTLV